MDSWVITIPKTTKWADYQKELAAVADYHQILNYKRNFSKFNMIENFPYLKKDQGILKKRTNCERQ